LKLKDSVVKVVKLFVGLNVVQRVDHFKINFMLRFLLFVVSDYSTVSSKGIQSFSSS